MAAKLDAVWCMPAEPAASRPAAHPLAGLLFTEIGRVAMAARSRQAAGLAQECWRLEVI